MRLFVGLWPPPPVLDAVARLRHPDHAGLRWTTREQWHVTLRFLGEVDAHDLPALTQQLEEGLAGHPAVEVTLGPAVEWLGGRRQGVLVVPTTGAAGLSKAVVEGTSGFGGPPEPRPFRGHLTLARVRRGHPAPAGLAGELIRATWRAEGVAVVRSHLEPSGARYETMAEVALARGI
ncbi:MAG: RNA 2',3'-cyclic phosphodiesterase [Acidimicrobiia bacterium]